MSNVISQCIKARTNSCTPAPGTSGRAGMTATLYFDDAEANKAIPDAGAFERPFVLVPCANSSRTEGWKRMMMDYVRSLRADGTECPADDPEKKTDVYIAVLSGVDAQGYYMGGDRFLFDLEKAKQWGVAFGFTYNHIYEGYAQKDFWAQGPDGNTPVF